MEALVPFFTPDTIREWPAQQLVLVGALGNDVVGVADGKSVGDGLNGCPTV